MATPASGMAAAVMLILIFIVIGRLALCNALMKFYLHSKAVRGAAEEPYAPSVAALIRGATLKMSLREYEAEDEKV